MDNGVSIHQVKHIEIALNDLLFDLHSRSISLFNGRIERTLATRRTFLFVEAYIWFHFESFLLVVNVVILFEF